ncbi:MAG: M16 family metallopeptidase [Phycisphaerae bacterium]
MEFKQAQLDNGLTIIAEVNPQAASMAAGFFVRSGSRDETPEVSGVSHFLEHMVFRGTERRSAADVNREYDEIGAEYNAFTSQEATVYYAAVLPEFQTRMLDVLCDILRPSLRQEDFDTEKKVIVEEIALYEDQPRFRVFDNLMMRFFDGHPLGNRILGTRESIAAMKRDDMQAYFDRRYSPGNVTLTAVGNVDFDALTDQANRMCSHWRAFDVDRDRPAAAKRTAREVMLDEKLSREHVGIMSPAPSNQDADRYAAHVAATIIGDDTGSRLFYALVDPAIADDAAMSYDPMDGAGAFVTFISADATRAADAVGIAHEQFRRFAADGPTDAELTAAKNKIASGATLKSERPMGRLTAVGFDWMYRGEYLPLEKELQSVFDVTRDDVMRVVRSWDITSTTVLALGPLDEI